MRQHKSAESDKTRQLLRNSTTCIRSTTGHSFNRTPTSRR